MPRSFLTTNHPYRETYGRFAWILLEGAMKTRRCLVVAILLFASSAPVWADDHAASVDALKTRAAQGSAEAQFALGLMSHNGQGIPQDYAEALKWYRLAAAQGSAEAQVNLGLMYHNGQGIPQDYAEALKWFRLAAAQGDVLAQSNLGLMYHNGQGVPQDYVQALKCFNLAAATSTKPDLHHLAVQSRDKVAARMTAAQIAEAQKRAREWKKQ
jgi:TPR repeat protein